MRIDLHAHTNTSDGTDSPAGLIAAARAADLDVVAITDHDTVGGWAEAADAVRQTGDGITLVRGVEMSCRRNDVSLHLLGYLFDPDDAALSEELSRLRNDRVPRLRAMVRRMCEAGMDLTFEQVEAEAADGATMGRPHLADAMIRAGIVATREEAFAAYLHRRSPYFVPHRAVDPVRAVELVRAAGGVAVLAHPAASRRGVVAPDELLTELAQAGLFGLEADHPDQDVEERRRVRALAGELGLRVTGASDYHGAGKVNRLGQETTDPEVFEELVGGAGCTVVEPQGGVA